MIRALQKEPRPITILLPVRSEQKDTWEAYNYVEQNPVMKVDPTGQLITPELSESQQAFCRWFSTLPNGTLVYDGAGLNLGGGLSLGACSNFADSGFSDPSIDFGDLYPGWSCAAMLHRWEASSGARTLPRVFRSAATRCRIIAVTRVT